MKEREAKMAEIVIRKTGEKIQDEERVKDFLARQGVLYERWDAGKLPAGLREKYNLSEEEKGEILHAFDQEIRSLAERNGYVKWDVISLSQATPNLEELLKKFEQIHTHSDDEVRAIVSGNGTFTIKGTSEIGYFNAVLQAGDVISVPKNTPHFFTLLENRKVVAIRLFIDQSGWIAHPYEDPEFSVTESK